MRAAAIVLLVCAQAPKLATAAPKQPAAVPKLAALVPADDARRVIAVGPAGEVYEPDGHGAWVRHHAFGVAVAIGGAARGAAGVVAAGGGAVFRLADNGWTAIRLAQHGTAVVSTGRRAVAAIGREVFELDRGAEPTRLAQAAAPVTAIAASSSGVVIETARGLFTLDKGKWKPIANVAGHPRLVSDRWAVVDGGAFDLRAGKLQSWPSGFQPATAAAMPDGGLAAVATVTAGLELVTVHDKRVERQPIPLAGAGVPVAMVVDAAGQPVIALADGRLVVRGHDGWSTVEVSDAVQAHPAGSPPATQ